MIILAIDPGTATTGFGVLEYEGNRFKVKDYGIISTEAKVATELRLQQIYDSIKNLIARHRPNHFVVEELFFNTNVRTAIAVGQARGVCLLVAADGGIPVAEYTPLQVKQSVVGYGRAEKAQVQQMVKAILNLHEIPKPDDAADALALAICHAHSYHANLAAEQANNAAQQLERAANGQPQASSLNKAIAQQLERENKREKERQKGMQ
ncbi:MAG TPA: crossover junction endodeoxyribonuclease RuvC [Candidatus Aquicultor sp.]|jgi:crossover junction endodeoxyribonuclease RuvC